MAVWRKSSSPAAGAGTSTSTNRMTSGPPACAISIALVFTFAPLLDHQFPVRLFRKLPLKANADCPGRLPYPPERNNMSNLSTSSALEDERNFDAEFEY